MLLYRESLSQEIILGQRIDQNWENAGFHITSSLCACITSEGNTSNVLNSHASMQKAVLQKIGISKQCYEEFTENFLDQNSILKILKHEVSR